MAVKRYNGSSWDTVAGLGNQGQAATSSSIATWVKTASGGETSLSGNDDNSQALSYTVGQELVFINGTLLKRGSDYTATNGTSITGLTALAANDVATVWTVNAFSVTGAIANTIVDAKGDILVGTAADTPGRLAVGTDGQVLTAASTTGTGLTWATPSTGAMTLIQRTSYSNVASQTFDNVFTSTYKVYQIVIETNTAVAPQDDFEFVFRYGTTDSTAHYGNSLYSTPGNTPTALSTSNLSWLKLSPGSGGSPYPWVATMTVHSVGTGSNARPQIYGSGFQNYDTQFVLFGGYADTNQNFTGFKVRAAASNITGTIAVYGWSAS
jgi:hypothetical protein